VLLNNGGLAVGIALVIIVVLLALAVGVLLKKRLPQKKQSVHSTMFQSILNIKELATIRQTFQSVVIFEDAKKILGGFVPIPGMGRKFILKYSGMIVCGNDLANIKITPRDGVNRVRMFVPRSKIMDIYPDIKSIHVYDQAAGLFTSITLHDQNREIVSNLEETRREALQSDILRRADENTRAILTTLVASMGLEAEIIFDDMEVGAIHTQELITQKSA
jgi:hypothetical protein